MRTLRFLLEAPDGGGQESQRRGGRGVDAGERFRTAVGRRACNRRVALYIPSMWNIQRVPMNALYL